LAVIRRLAYIAVALLFLLIAALLAYANPEPMAIDVGIARFENVSVTLVLACAFGLGWVFGLICAGLAILRVLRDRNRMRRDLRYAESERSALRALPLQDAN
jgi:putative copper export protein